MILGIILVIGTWIIFEMAMHTAEGQTPPANAPPKATTPTPPPATLPPTVVNTPTPTSPLPNLQYLPQKAYVQSYAPEIGIPTPNVPLQSAPVVQAPALQAPTTQSSIPGIDIAAMLALGGTAINFVKNHFTSKTTKANSEMNVQQAIVQQKTLEQLYENMPDKGESIKDKPEIQLREIADLKEKAVNTNTKS